LIDLQKGLKVDVLDTEGIWCKGIILETFTIRKGKKIVKVHY